MNSNTKIMISSDLSEFLYFSYEFNFVLPVIVITGNIYIHYKKKHLIQKDCKRKINFMFEAS